METVKAVKDFAKSLTKGKYYSVIRIVDNNIVIIDDSNDEIGFGQEYFENVNSFNALKVAKSLVNLMYYTNGDEQSELSHDKAKQQALVAIAFAIENADTPELLNKFKEVQTSIQEITL